MAWWGKIVGGALGFMLGGAVGLGVIGAILGVVIGRKFDQGFQSNNEPFGNSQERMQAAFFTVTFAVMGHVAKADGHVSASEIRHAKQVMGHMSLNEDQRKVAIGLFQEGKKTGFPLEDVLEQFRKECGHQRNLKRMFMEIQIRAALADGRMDAKENEALIFIANRIGFSQAEFETFLGSARGGSEDVYHHASNLEDDYKVLGISSSADDDEVKRAYRRLMSQYHPDKLVAKGLPEEMMKVATEKTAEIRGAYERIRESRKQSQTIH